MKKLCSLLIFSILFFSVKSFAGNHLSNSTGIKPSGNPASFPKDTAKKVQAANTAADDTDDDDNVRSYAIGLTYGTDQSFHGIHSNAKTPYIEPNFTYTAPSGFYVELSFQDILVKDSGGTDAMDINPGWDITLGDNTILNFNLSHYTFRAKTPLAIRSDLSNALETYIDQSIGNTDAKFSIDYDYYKQTAKVKTPGDIVMTPDLSHTFEITLSKKSTLSIDPEGSIDFGTRNAYTQYQANIGVDSVEVKKNGKVVKVRQDANNSSFGTLDYSLILTLDLKIGNFEIEPTFNYNKGLYEVAGVPNAPLKYGTLALIYTIDHKKRK